MADKTDVSAELLKEYIRDLFHKNPSIATDSLEALERFVRIFAGEMEAVLAIQFATYLTKRETTKLYRLAKPTARTVRELQAFDDHVQGRKTVRGLD